MSDDVFIIRNQLGQYWIRAGEWVDGREPQRILKIKHQDEAINLLVELSAKDIDLRGEVIRADLDERGDPDVPASDHQTPTLAEQAAEKARLEAAREAANDEESADADTTEPSVGAGA